MILSKVFNSSPKFLRIVWVNVLERVLFPFRNSDVALVLWFLYLEKIPSCLECLCSKFLLLIMLIGGGNVLVGVQQSTMLTKLTHQLDLLVLM